MTEFFDVQKFAAHVRTKRGAQSLREVVSEVKGVSISTLSRIENGKIPDMETFLHICDWLDASPDDFMRSEPTPQEPKRSTLEQILLLLRMDTSLDAEVVEALVVLLQRLIGRERGRNRMLTVTLADKSGLKWAQEQVLQHHYLHTPVDARCSPVAMLVKLFDRPVGCLIFGRPEATRVNGWYGSVEDAQTGRCQLTRWEVLNLARVWLDPSLQPEGEWYHPQGLIGPSVLPGFYDRKHSWHSSAASYVIDRAVEQIVFHYLYQRPPVWMEEPYEVYVRYNQSVRQEVMPLPDLLRT